MDIEVVAAAPDDWQRVRAVRLAALADTPDAFAATLADEEADPEEAWRGRLARTDAVTLLAVDGQDEVVGITVVAPAYRDPMSGAVYAVWVAPAARGSGAADLLLTAAVAHARRLGYPRLVLDVGDHNTTADRLYARHGFQPTGRTYRFDPPREHLTEHELALDLDQPYPASGTARRGW